MAATTLKGKGKSLKVASFQGVELELIVTISIIKPFDFVDL